MGEFDLLSEASAPKVLQLCSSLMSRFFQAVTIKELTEITNKTFEDLIPLDYNGLYLYNDESERLDLLIARGFSEQERKVAEETAMERHPGTVFRTGKQIYIPDTESDEQQITSSSPRSFEVRCRLYSPIEIGGKRIGVFGVVSSRVNAFSDTDIELFKFICKLFGKVFVNIKNKESLERVNKELKILSFLATHTDNSVILTDDKGYITWVNEEFIRLTGYSFDEMKGKKPGHLLQGKRSDPELIQQIGQALSKKESFNCVIRNYAKSGKEYYADLSIYPFYDEHGNFTNFISLQRDVTKEKEYQDLIEQQKKRLDAVLHSIPDLLITIDRTGKIEEALFNKDFHESIADHNFSGESIFSFLEESEHERIQKHIRQVFISSGIFTIDTAITINHAMIHVEVRTVRMDQNHVLCLIRNTQQQYLMNKEREDAQIFNNLLADNSIKLGFASLAEIEESINDFLSASGSFFNAAAAFCVDVDLEDCLFRSRKFIFSQNKWIYAEGSFIPQQDIVIQLIKNLKPDEIIQVPNVFKNKENAGELNLIQSIGFSDVNEFTIVPVFLQGKLSAFFGFTELNNKLIQKQADLTRLKLVGELIISAKNKRNYLVELAKFKSVFDHGYFGAIIINHRNEIIYTNSYVWKYFSQKTAGSSVLKANDLFENLNQSNVEFDFEALCKNNSDQSNIVQITKPDHSEIHLLFRHQIIHLNNASKPLVALSFIDITDRVIQENETNRALQIVSEQNRKLLNFSYIVSHNIRSHASNISGFINLALTEDDPESLRTYIDALARSSNALDGTLRHLNELLNIQSRVGVQSVFIDLHDVVEKTINALYSDLSQIEHTIDINIPEGFMIHTDQAYADSILLNLISNAIKYRKQKHPLRISISAYKSDFNSVIKVSDNGKGIDMDKYGEKVFGMFKTFHGNKDARGIGLFITKNQIESLGGSIHLESSPGYGAVFTITLPD